MKIIKENFYTVVKLWINQFGSVFLAALLLLPATSLADKYNIGWLLLAVSLFTVIFYLVLIFWVCCEFGLKDNVPIETGRMPFKWYKGTLIALTANLPVILLCTVACISKLCIPASLTASVDNAAGAAANVYFVTEFIERILHLMYQGTLVFAGWTSYTFLHLFFALLSVTVCTVGYIAGTKGFLASLLSKKA